LPLGWAIILCGLGFVFSIRDSAASRRLTVSSSE